MSQITQQLRERYGLTALIAVLVIALLGLIGVETQWGQGLGPASRVQAAKGNETSILPAFALPAMETGFKETVDRPLFMSTRRPAPVSTAAQQVMKKGQFRLAGTILNQELPYAFLVEISTGKGMRVAKGAEIVSSGITVSAIDNVRVVLKQGEETEELTLRTAASPPPPVSAPAAGTPGVPGAGQRPPPSGVVVGGVPTAAGAAQARPAPAGSAPTPPAAGSSVLPGFVLPQPAAVPNAAPANQTDGEVGTQRRRRFPNQNVPQQ